VGRAGRWPQDTAPQAEDGGPLLQPVLAALLLAGVLSSVIALLQVFAPQWTDGEWIARSGLPAARWATCASPTTSAH
jgi:hypothetical protein